MGAIEADYLTKKTAAATSYYVEAFFLFLSRFREFFSLFSILFTLASSFIIMTNCSGFLAREGIFFRIFKFEKLLNLIYS